MRQLLNFKYRKKLPAGFGPARIYVTPRADARILRAGWTGVAPDLIAVVDAVVKPGDVVWDIGANQGILAFLAAHRVGQTGAVYALEADPPYADMIFASAQGLPAGYADVTVLCAAIWDRPSLVDFAISAKGHARNRIDTQDTPKDYQVAVRKSVATVTADFLSAHWRAPDFVKIDVEGAEFEALSGATTLLSEQRPVFYVEVSDSNAEGVTDLFRRHDYKISKLRLDGSEEPTEKCSFYTIARPSEQRG